MITHLRLTSWSSEINFIYLPNWFNYFTLYKWVLVFIVYIPVTVYKNLLVPCNRVIANYKESNSQRLVGFIVSDRGCVEQMTRYSALSFSNSCTVRSWRDETAIWLTKKRKRLFQSLKKQTEKICVRDYPKREGLLYWII